MEDSEALARFYDDAYSQTPAQAQLYSRWRAFGAIGKADHVVELCARAGVRPTSTVEVGCGDGALLHELHERGFGGRLAGFEITDAAVRIAAQRPEIESVERYDGHRIPVADGAFELGVLSHVLEHVQEPATLLREVGRACRAVVLEVPLEANWSARRAGKRVHAAEVGHLQRLDVEAVHAFVAEAGLSLRAELEDALPLRAHSFFASTPRARATATAKWAARSGLHRLSAPLARRVFTVHYACLCLSPGA